MESPSATRIFEKLKIDYCCGGYATRLTPFSFLYKLSPQLSWGMEFRRLETRYLLTGRQTANHVNLGAAYSF